MNRWKKLHRYSVLEIGAVMDELRRDYDIVRLVDVEECRVLAVEPDGSISYQQECFEVWGRDHRCENCTSFRACHTHCTVDKHEYLGSKREDIHSVPIELELRSGESQSCVVECVRYSGIDEEGSRAAAELDATFDKSHDVLTRLYSPEKVLREIRRTLMDRPGEEQLLLMVNIRSFRMLNQLFGVDGGNRLLAGLGDLLREQCPPGSVYGRYRDDRFLILAPKSRLDPEALARRLQERANTIVESPIVDVRIKLGVLPVTDLGLPVKVMAEHAELAADDIRDERDRSVSYFHPSLLERKLRDQRIITNFEKALQDGEFQAYLQPQVREDGAILGAETLVRWVRPDRILPPAEFLPVLAKSELLSHMDECIWQQAISALGRWQGTPLERLTLSVNVDPTDFYFLDVPARLSELCDQYGVPHGSLHVELTENALAEDMEHQSHMADRLNAAGFPVLIDDFGRGSSSLSFLKDVKAHMLKIDMGFLHGTRNKDRSQIIVGSVIRMAGKLGMEVLTEGVETKAQLEKLVSIGCHCFQGFFFSRPIPIRDFEALVRDAG